MARENLNWRSFVDPGAIAARWKPAGTPTFYLIDHQEVIRYKWAGAPGEKVMDAALDKVIAEAEGAGKRPPVGGSRRAKSRVAEQRPREEGSCTKLTATGQSVGRWPRLRPRRPEGPRSDAGLRHPAARAGRSRASWRW